MPGQNPEEILRAVRDFVAENTPLGIQVAVRELYSAPASLVSPDHPAIRTAAQALEDVFGRPAAFIRSGGSIPVVGDITEHLAIPTVLMGFGLPDDGLHSPNEKFSIDNYYKAIQTVSHFFELLANTDMGPA